MENIILIVHLIIALFLIAVVLLQRSEGGALGIGGGGGGLVTGRTATTALTRVTWFLGAAFVATSLLLTVLSVRSEREASVVSGQGGAGEVQILVPDVADSPVVPSGDAPATPPAE